MSIVFTGARAPHNLNQQTNGAMPTDMIDVKHTYLLSVLASDEVALWTN